MSAQSHKLADRESSGQAMMLNSDFVLHPSQVSPCPGHLCTGDSQSSCTTGTCAQHTLHKRGCGCICQWQIPAFTALVKQHAGEANGTNTEYSSTCLICHLDRLTAKETDTLKNWQMAFQSQKNLQLVEACDDLMRPLQRQACCALQASFPEQQLAQSLSVPS